MVRANVPHSRKVMHQALKHFIIKVNYSSDVLP